ncbi:MAG: hypothetical protein H3C35_05650 [Bacteroidetes bacterium]|nr:hypothetical protein [Bacteroidota bacterium]
MKAGTRVAVINHKNGFEIAKIDKNYFLRYAGILNTKGKILADLMEENQKEKLF